MEDENGIPDLWFPIFLSERFLSRPVGPPTQTQFGERQMGYGIFGFLVLIADLYAIYQVMTSSAGTAAKVAWTVVILVLPVIGFLVWVGFGPRGRATAA
ncbi:PLD nuclease N-terminal domain-containing protein [Loktanella sp. F6476L]|uniref:PLD nuclease N-terminal domain-containing protein n=2 Tax=Rhodobacterales TaxID=204455 RepID=UPI0032B30F16